MAAHASQVLPRLIALPDSVATAAQKAAWKSQLGLLPPLPAGPALNSQYNKDKIYPVATGEGFPTTGAGKSVLSRLLHQSALSMICLCMNVHRATFKQ